MEAILEQGYDKEIPTINFKIFKQFGILKQFLTMRPSGEII